MSEKVEAMWKHKPPERRWFQDKDGTYYRNIPLIMNEQKEELARVPQPWGWRRHFAILDALAAEWHHAWCEGVIRKDSLDRGDVVVTPAPFREVYPDKPGLWFLDEA